MCVPRIACESIALLNTLLNYRATERGSAVGWETNPPCQKNVGSKTLSTFCFVFFLGRRAIMGSGKELGAGGTVGSLLIIRVVLEVAFLNI